VAAARGMGLFALAALCAVGLPACGPKSVIRPSETHVLEARAGGGVDTAPKEELRMVPPEAYMRTYLALFGGLVPLDAQARARGTDGAQLFDTWDDYFSALGFPDYRLDLPRAAQTNALMIATFERLGVALCDRAVEHDLGHRDLAVARVGPPPPRPMGRKPGGAADEKRERAERRAERQAERQRDAMGNGAAQGADADAGSSAGAGGALPASGPKVLFTFEMPRGPLDAAAFAPRFDVLHRRFLGYPAELAPPERAGRFFALYQSIVARHSTVATGSTGAGRGRARFTPEQAGWAAVCYGLVRHPEFQLY
jgi:hypothetical protein